MEMSGPNPTVVPPEIKLEPVRRILSDCPRTPETGAILVNVGTGSTENAEVSVAVPPPGEGFVTVTERGPNVAAGAIDMDATSEFALVTSTVLTVIPEPIDTVVAPPTKPLPWMVIESDTPGVPCAGAILAMDGTGFWTWNPFEYVAEPYEFVTVTSRKPAEADALTDMDADSCVADETVTEFTVIPEPLNPTLALPASKQVPAIFRLKDEPRNPTDGEIDVIVG